MWKLDKRISDIKVEKHIKITNIIVIIVLAILLVVLNTVNCDFMLEFENYINIISDLILSVLGGYIIYFFTVHLLYSQKEKSCKHIFEKYINQLSNYLRLFMSALFNNTDWENENDIKLKTDLQSRKDISKERYSKLFKEDTATLLYKPLTLTVIDYEIKKINETIEKIVSISEYCNDDDLLKSIEYLSQSQVFMALSVCEYAVKAECSDSYSYDYINELFCNALPEYIFCNLDDNEIFIKQVRNILKKSEELKCLK